MAGGRWQKLVFRTLVALCSGSLCLVVLLLYLHVSEQITRQDTVQESIGEFFTQAAVEALNLAFETIKPRVMALGKMLSNDSLQGEALRQALQTAFYKDTRTSAADAQMDAPNVPVLTILPIFEVGVAYAPAAHDPQKRYAPHYGYKDGEPQHFLLDYDYTNRDTYPWYTACLAGPQWIKPYFGGSTRALVTGYCAPLYAPQAVRQANARPIGVVRINFSLESIAALINRFIPGTSGYSVLYAWPEGHILAQSNADYAVPEHGKDPPTIMDLKQEWEAKNFVYYERKMRVAHLGLAMVYRPWELHLHDSASRRSLIRLLIVGILFLGSLGLLLCRTYTGAPQSLWHGVRIVAGLLSVAIGVIWYLAYTISDHNMSMENETRWHTKSDVEAECATPADTDAAQKARNPIDPVRCMITDEVTLQTLLVDVARQQAGRRHVRRKHEQPIYIPTGVFLQSIEFTSANNVIVTGYIWQRYATDIPERTRDTSHNADTAPGISRGFVFPEAESVEMEIQQPVYRRLEHNEEVLGWYFKVTLRQNFNYTKYPFDRVDVWIRIWHRDFDRNVILIPDFAAYDRITPTARPGLEADFVLPGWTIAQSFFFYRLNSYNTDFGIQDYIGQHKFPELYFNVRLRRNFINPFIANILPLTAVTFMLFATLMSGTKHEDRVQLLGFQAIGVLGICAAFFFTVVVAHVTLRSQIDAEDVLYIEYFYFMMYCTILAVAMNALLFIGNEDIKWMQYQDNLLSKLLYWPLLLVAMLGITLWVFY